MCQHNFGHNAIVGASSNTSIMATFQHKEDDNKIIIIIIIPQQSVLGHFYFQVLLVRINIFKGLIATFNVLLHRCITLLAC